MTSLTFAAKYFTCSLLSQHKSQDMLLLFSTTQLVAHTSMQILTYHKSIKDHDVIQLIFLLLLMSVNGKSCICSFVCPYIICYAHCMNAYFLYTHASINVNVYNNLCSYTPYQYV